MFSHAAGNKKNSCLFQVRPMFSPIILELSLVSLWFVSIIRFSTDNVNSFPTWSRCFSFANTFKNVYLSSHGCYFSSPFVTFSYFYVFYNSLHTHSFSFCFQLALRKVFGFHYWNKLSSPYTHGFYFWNDSMIISLFVGGGGFVSHFFCFVPFWAQNFESVLKFIFKSFCRKKTYL